MYKDYQEYQGKTWKRVTARVAKREFNVGREVLLLPVKARFNNKWIPPFEVSQSNSQAFESIKKAYEYSNCNHELGTYCKYYIVSSDL
jgi:hypothetical protein